jgi:hypothetical protein
MSNSWPRVVFAIVTGLAGVACDRKDAAGDAPAGAPSTPAVPAAKPGVAAGRIYRPDGKPIGIDKAKYQVTITGVAGRGENVAYSPSPDAGGAWSTKLADGIYRAPRATAVIPFAGDVFNYVLVPTADVLETDSTAKGIVADFVWQISGPHKMYEDKPDPGNHTHWFGATSSLVWNPTYPAGEGRQKSHEIPKGTTFSFTATPKGKRIDGADGKPLTWTRGWDWALGVVPNTLNDMPPTTGGYRITGKAVAPDGKERPVLFNQVGAGETYAAEIDITVVADRTYGTPFAPMLRVTLPPP